MKIRAVNGERNTNNKLCKLKGTHMYIFTCAPLKNHGHQFVGVKSKSQFAQLFSKNLSAEQTVMVSTEIR